MAVGRGIDGIGKDHRAIVRRLVKEQGWTFVLPRRGHPQVVSPGGTAVVFPGSPGDVRAIRHFRSTIRQIQKAEGLRPTL